MSEYVCVYVCMCVHVYLLSVVAQLEIPWLWTPENTLLYCITCPVGSFFKTGSFKPVSLYMPTPNLSGHGQEELVNSIWEHKPHTCTLSQSNVATHHNRQLCSTVL